MSRIAIASIVVMSCALGPVATQAPYLVSDIYPGLLNHSSPHDLVAVGDRVAFLANSAGAFDELWSSDGTAAGTVHLQPGVRAFMLAGGPTRAFMASGRLGGDVWMTDGTLAGTSAVPVNAARLTGSVVTAGDRLFAARGPFLFYPGPSTVIATDGTSVQTLATVQPPDFTRMLGLAGDDVVWVSGPLQMALPRTVHSRSSGVLGTVPEIDYDRIYTGTKRLFFGGPDVGPHLYETDGVRLRTVFSGAGGVQGPAILGVVDDDLYFWADAGGGPAIWVDDLATPSPRIVTTFAAAGMTLAAGPGAQIGDALVFWGVGTQGFQPWILQGGTARQISTTGSFNGSLSTRFNSVGSRKAFFYTGLGSARDLYWTDGTTIQFVGYAGTTNQSDRVTLAGRLAYFTLYDPQAGIELFALDPGATARSVGVTCGGPWMRADDPVIGTTAAISGEAAAGDVGTVLLSGGSVAPGIEVFGCELYVNPLASPVLELGAFAVSATGRWSSALPVPAQPALVGAPLLLQAAFVGARVTTSNGVVMFLGR